MTNLKESTSKELERYNISNHNAESLILQRLTPKVYWEHRFVTLTLPYGGRIEGMLILDKAFWNRWNLNRIWWFKLIIRDNRMSFSWFWDGRKVDLGYSRPIVCSEFQSLQILETLIYRTPERPLLKILSPIFKICTLIKKAFFFKDPQNIYLPSRD